MLFIDSIYDNTLTSNNLKDLFTYYYSYLSI